MDFESTYNHVFFEIKNYLGKLEIDFRYLLMNETVEDGYHIHLTSKTSWSLNVTSFCGYSWKKYQTELPKRIDIVIQYINQHRIELDPFFDNFLERIEGKITTIKQVELDPHLFVADSSDFVLIYKGYDGDLKLSIMLRNVEEGSQEPELPFKRLEDEDSIVIARAHGHFVILIHELERLALAIRHEMNLSEIQSKSLSEQKKNTHLIDLIKKAKFTELFEKLDTMPEFQHSEDVIQLSSRFYSLEQDKNQGVLKREEYELEKTKIITSIISLITRN